MIILALILLSNSQNLFRCVNPYVLQSSSTFVTVLTHAHNLQTGKIRFSLFIHDNSPRKATQMECSVSILKLLLLVSVLVNAK